MSRRTTSTLISFNFNGNSLHLAAAIEASIFLSHQYTCLRFYLLGSGTRYPSKMSRGIDLPPRSLRSEFKELDLSCYFEEFDFLIEEPKKSRPLHESEVVLIEKSKHVLLQSEISEISTESFPIGGLLTNCYANEFEFVAEKEPKKGVLATFIRSYFDVFLFAHKILKENEADVIIYNGRFLHERAVVDAARSLGRKVWHYETTQNRFHLRDEGFHNRERNQEYMKTHWASSPLTFFEKEKIASTYFADLRSPKNRFYTSRDLSIPFASGDYFSYFTNSDNEAIGFWDNWKNPMGRQLEVVKKLARLCERNEVNLVIRLHPNLKNAPRQVQDSWKMINESKFVHVVPIDSSFSSYDLLDGSRGVISFGSTVGLEAAFYRRPSAVLSDCLYDELGAVDKISSIEELQDWLIYASQRLSRDDIEKRYIGALIRGFWQRSAGREFVHCETEETSEGAFRVVRIMNVETKRLNKNFHLGIIRNKVKRIRLGLLN